MVTYEAWFDPENVSYTLAPVLEIERQRSTGLLSAAAEFLYRFDAATHEEAMAIHHLRLGYGPYRPVGEPRPCLTARHGTTLMGVRYAGGAALLPTVLSGSFHRCNWLNAVTRTILALLPAGRHCSRRSGTADAGWGERGETNEIRRASRGCRCAARRGYGIVLVADSTYVYSRLETGHRAPGLQLGVRRAS